MKKIIGGCVGLLLLLWLITPYQVAAEVTNRTDAAISFEEAQKENKGKLPSTYVPKENTSTYRGQLPYTGELVQSFIFLLAVIEGLIICLCIFSFKRICDSKKGGEGE
ncbi:hypothetical protein [Enterococcus ureasiticus]|uniref:PDGLE domain-containing protein n=1 Tax=Enterococcus ureasiticus TaxID=903984 RepID=A0A1E5GAB4_9ENTE|nr:hypothetical protein [Enterococcus ureasiticus]OEG09656.1 hypothetical protein BCR21_15045 [Enterococcus ureasiticus]